MHASRIELAVITGHKCILCGIVQTTKEFASKQKSLAASKYILSKKAHIMNAKTKTALVIAFVVVALLLLLFGGGMMTGTMMSGGMMGSGMMGSGMIGGISWMWLPILLVVVLGVVLSSVFFGKK